MPAASVANNAPWESKHDLEVIRAIISSAISNRSAIYALRALADVNNNGGDRINKRLQSLLTRMVAGVKPEAEGLVKEEVGKLGRGGKRKAAGDDDGSPSKKTTPKKVKSKEVVESSGEE